MSEARAAAAQSRQDLQRRNLAFRAEMDNIRNDDSLSKDEREARIREARIRRPSLAGDDEMQEFRIGVHGASAGDRVGCSRNGERRPC